MGQTLRSLSYRLIPSKAVFNNRFVIEICEQVHIHYRNLRIILNKADWLNVARGFRDALERWEKLGSPEPKQGTHYELCRKNIEGSEELFKINLNKNLYPKYEGKIFSEGAEIKDETYIHLKLRDLRVELSWEEFNKLADMFAEAKNRISETIACEI